MTDGGRLNDAVGSFAVRGDQRARGTGPRPRSATQRRSASGGFCSGGPGGGPSFDLVSALWGGFGEEGAAEQFGAFSQADQAVGLGGLVLTAGPLPFGTVAGLPAAGVVSTTVRVLGTKTVLADTGVSHVKVDVFPVEPERFFEARSLGDLGHVGRDVPAPHSLTESDGSSLSSLRAPRPGTRCTRTSTSYPLNVHRMWQRNLKPSAGSWQILLADTETAEKYRSGGAQNSVAFPGLTHRQPQSGFIDSTRRWYSGC